METPKPNKYRVKVVVRDKSAWDTQQITKYLIQKHTFIGWIGYCASTTDKEWAYSTCEELNTPYEELLKKIRK